MGAITLLTKCTGEELKGLRCAVTGGCGFLGCYIVKLTLDAGAASVVVLDVRHSPLFDEVVGAHPKVKIHICDVRDKEEVHNALKGVDVVFHTASYFGTPAFASKHFNDHKKVFDINVMVPKI